ncbi:hypothetical protein ACJRO7_034439 [Eucalyptus globulus]|uniref:B3 domain-containing protein n=1 Tax=Eucalyptus globulus TaxID=34317 RepID=A0ABD3J3R1_EUCGL
MGYQSFPAATVYFRSANRLSKGERKMKLDFSSLNLLADVASFISEGKLSLGPSIFDRDGEKKLTLVTTTTFGPIGVGWIVRKKRSPRARRPTFHAQTSSSDPFVVVQNNKQEPSRAVAENHKKRSRTFDSSETQEWGRVSKKPKKTPQTGLAALIGPSKLPTKYMDKIQEMRGQDMTLVVEKTLTATDMSRGQSRLSIPNKQIRQGFLSEEEIQMLDRKEGIKVSLIEPCLEVSHGLQLKRWNYQSKNFSYVLTERWNGIAHPYARNELMKDVVIQLWSFRVDNSLWFCLKKVEDQQGNGKDGCDLPPIS